MEVAETEPEACGPINRRTQVFHISALVEALTQGMNLFSAAKNYDVDPLVNSGTKKSLAELATKIDEIIDWLSKLRKSIKGRIQ